MYRRLALLLFGISITCSLGWAGSSDEYFRLARLSYLDGNVSFQHSGEVDWTAASINMPLQPGDRIYSGNNGRVEIEFDDGSVYRLAEKTDVEILSLKEDLIQVRVLLGLSTLTVQSGVNFEVDTPAAAFNTLRKGIYRFDVVENGDTDAIVRKGLLEAANDQFSRQLDSGGLLHVIPGDKGEPALSQYDQRDDWDDWNDRRNADMLAYNSRKYLPDNVYMGASELDSYGRWVTVDAYGAAWVPYNMDPYWSPYWEGRWCYRPFWGWTWVSYEPWGWLPYHYGRWYHSLSFGWCWLPGPSFGFNFWSPGLVRFYNGPGWISWCALGPHDYYNINNYYFNRANIYQLNNLRLLQTRAPDDLVNRSVPGAFRTVQTDHFVGSSLGARSRIPTVNVDQPWSRGQMVTDRLGVQPTARSYAPAPDRPAMRPAAQSRLPVVVRSQPSVPVGSQERVVRITNPNVTPLPSSRSEGARQSGSATPAGRGTTIWNRVEPGNATVAEPGRRQTSPGTVEPSGNSGRSQERVYKTPQQTAPPSERRVSPPPVVPPPNVNRGRENPKSTPAVRPESNPPRRMESIPAAPRIERQTAPERKTEPNQAKPSSRPRSNESDMRSVYSQNSYAAQNASRNELQGPRTVYFGGGQSSNTSPRNNSVERQQAEVPAYVPPSYSRGGGYAAPSFSRGESYAAPASPRGGWSPPPARTYVAPPAGHSGGSFGGGFGGSAPSRSGSTGNSAGGRHRGR